MPRDGGCQHREPRAPERALQATLLSVSIALILALLAALVGPHFVDWSQYRSTFETEASRLTGMRVRVAGAIDARLLPTPSLVLKDVEAGAGAGADVPQDRKSVV